MNYSELKVWIRSASRRFAYDNRHNEPDDHEPIGSVVWHNGDGKPICYHRGMGQAALINSILFRPGKKAEYWLPDPLSPRVILDIGANIGATSRYLQHRYPTAEVYSFEPIPANIELLRRNLPGNARIFPFGLGKENEVVTFRSPTGWTDNSGGYSQYNEGTGSSSVAAEIRKVEDTLADLQINRVDVIKIDTEGAEYDILTTFPIALLSNVTWIYGELHGEDIDRPTDFKLLDFLSEWFDIAIQKPIRRRNYFFDACNRREVVRYRRFLRWKT